MLQQAQQQQQQQQQQQSSLVRPWVLQEADAMHGLS